MENNRITLRYTWISYCSLIQVKRTPKLFEQPSMTTKQHRTRKKRSVNDLRGWGTSHARVISDNMC